MTTKRRRRQQTNQMNFFFFAVKCVLVTFCSSFFFCYRNEWEKKAATKMNAEVDRTVVDERKQTHV